MKRVDLLYKLNGIQMNINRLFLSIEQEYNKYFEIQIPEIKKRIKEGTDWEEYKNTTYDYLDRLEKVMDKSEKIGPLYEDKIKAKQKEYDEEIKRGEEKYEKINNDMIEEKKHIKFKRILMAVICFLIAGIFLMIQYKDLFKDMNNIIDKIKQGNFNILNDIYTILKAVANIAFIAAPMMLGIYQIIQLHRELKGLDNDNMGKYNKTRYMDNIISEAQKHLEEKTKLILQDYENELIYND